jgi:glutamate racemase
MMIAYALEARAPLFVLIFACACLSSSAYGFLQGAWPFGVVEIVWAGVAFLRWRRRTTAMTMPVRLGRR